MYKGIKNIIGLGASTFFAVGFLPSVNAVSMKAACKDLLASKAQPSWPKSRDLKRYSELLNLNFSHEIGEFGNWIDVGPGENAAALQGIQPRFGRRIAISSHKVVAPKDIEVIYEQIPEGKSLSIYRDRASLVTDVYAAISYHKDPIEALIYESLLLKKKGKLVSFTERNRFGDPKVWPEISSFFSEFLGISLSFETVQIKADSNSKVEVGLRLVAVRDKMNKASLSELLALAHLKLGKPQLTNTIWETADGTHKINRVDYVKPDRY